MSSVIDERVVSMRFDNKDFEDHARQSIETLKNLKNCLNFDGASEGLEEVAKTVKGLDFNGVVAAVETVQSKFSAFEVVAITALANITNSAINAGKQMVSSLTVDQVTAGFSKYEEKTRAVQTIMAATNKPIEEVEANLAKLNWFSDETSYSFTDMVNNIGKFTSAGVPLEDAVTAMMGISNEAALAGQGINEASRAMYNLAQALGTGSVKLIDWRSIENANMATSEFKQNIIDTALSLGALQRDADGTVRTIEKGTEVTRENFNSALSEGWFNKDVLIEVLKHYGSYAESIYAIHGEFDSCAEAMEAFDAQADVSGNEILALGSKAFKAAQVAKTFTDAIDATKDAVSTGWMDTFQLIFGNFNEASVLWTDLAGELWEVFASGAQARNDLLRAWRGMDDEGTAGTNGLDGRVVLLEAIATAWDSIKVAVDNVKEAFAGLFPEIDAQTLLDWTNGFKEATEKFGSAIISGSEKFKGFFQDTIEVAKTAEEFIKDNLDPVGNSIAGIGSLLGGFEDVYVDTFETITKETGVSVAGIGSLLDDFAGDYSALSTTLEETDEKVSNIGLKEWLKFENATLATKGFKNGIMQTAVELGTLERTAEGFVVAGTDMLVTADDFKRTLSSGWLTTDVFETTVAKMGDAGAEYTKLWDRINSVTDSTQGFKSALDSASTSVAGIGSALGELNDIYKDDESYLMSNSLAGIGLIIENAEQGIETIEEATQEVDTNLNRIKRTFRGIFAAFDIAKQLFTAVAEAVMPLIGLTPKLASGFFGITASVGDNIVELDKYLKKTDFFREKINSAIKFVQSIPGKISDAFKELTGMSLEDVFTNLRNSVTGAVDAIKKSVSDFTGIDLSGFKKAKGEFSLIGTLFEGLKAVFSFIGGLIEKLSPSLQKAGVFLSEAFTEIGTSVSEFITSANFNDLNRIYDILTKIFSGGLIANFGIEVKRISDQIATFLEAPEGVIDVLDETRFQLRALTQTVQAENLKILATSIAILTASLIGMSLIDPDKLALGVGAIAALMKIMSGGMNFGMRGNSALGMIAMPFVINQTAAAMKSFAIAVLILTGAMAIMSFLDWDGVLKGLVGVSVIMTLLSKSIKSIVDVKGRGLPQVTIAMILMATALTIVASAVKKFGKLSLAELAKGLIATSLSLTIITNAVKKLSELKGVSGIGVGLILIATSLMIVASAVKSFGSASVKTLAKGLISLALALAAITVALNFMPENVAGIGAGLILVSAAINLLAMAFTSFGSLDWENVGIALVGMAGALTLLVVAMAGASRVGAGAAGILAASAAMVVLAGAFGILSLLSLGDILAGLLAMGGALLLFGVAAFALAPITPVLLTISGAIALFGVGCLAAGVGIFALVTAITAFATSLIVNAGAVTLAIQEILSLIPSIIMIIIQSIAQILVAIANAGSAIVESLVTLGLAILQAIIELANPLGEAVYEVIKALSEWGLPIMQVVLDLILDLLELILVHAQDFVVAAIYILLEVIAGIKSHTYLLAMAAVDLVVAFINSLAAAIEYGLPEIGKAVENLCKSILKGILGFFGIKSPSKVMTDVGDDISQGLINGIKNRKSDAGNAMEDVGQSILGGITGLFSGMFGAGKTSGEEFAEGLSDAESATIDASGDLSDLASGVLGSNNYSFLFAGENSGDSYAYGLGNSNGSITDTLSWVLSNTVGTANSYTGDFYAAGVNAGEGYRQGLADMAGAIRETSDQVAGGSITGILSMLDEHSPSRKTFWIGQMFDQGFINGMLDMTKDVQDTSADIGGMALDGIQYSVDNALDALWHDTDIQPKITPVLDLSQVTDGAQRINGLLGSGYSMKLAGVASLDANAKLSKNLDGINVNNSSVVSAIRDMRADIQNLGDSISRIQMVMDTGAVVGALAAPMDAALGRRAVYAGRGI